MTGAAADIARISLRLPRDVHGRLVQIATAEDRSLHAQIIWCLRQCIDEGGPPRRRGCDGAGEEPRPGAPGDLAPRGARARRRCDEQAT